MRTLMLKGENNLDYSNEYETLFSLFLFSWWLGKPSETACKLLNQTIETM